VENKPNASSNTIKTRLLDVPELHFWVGSQSACEKLQEIFSEKQAAWVNVHTEFNSYIAPFKQD